MSNNNLYKKIITHFGTAINAAKYFKVSENTIYNWKHNIPLFRIKEIEKALKKDVSIYREKRFELPNEIIIAWHLHITQIKQNNKRVNFGSIGTTQFLYEKLDELEVKTKKKAIQLIEIAIENDWATLDNFDERVLSHIKALKEVKREIEEKQKNNPQPTQQPKQVITADTIKKQPVKIETPKTQDDVMNQLTSGGQSLFKNLLNTHNQNSIHWVHFDSEVQYNSFVKNLNIQNNYHATDQDKSLIKQFLKKDYASRFTYLQQQEITQVTPTQVTKPPQEQPIIETIQWINAKEDTKMKLNQDAIRILNISEDHIMRGGNYELNPETIKNITNSYYVYYQDDYSITTNDMNIINNLFIKFMPFFLQQRDKKKLKIAS